ncbi:SDR family oxidoreductase [Burkholderia glumae]|uniref:SDR family oxidoreductase n=1 Tax=Burkholderia glumae TaxID=337 RepID=UPI000C26DECC|nr:SDR family oxidoreductase [Burkholderia glumae]PJO22344.1 hypothetical protein Y5A_014760 [Burkholderia glumae AU6208]QHE09398.1 SDR family oxidoreductase [Burkholderia glumae AU6208]
MSGSMDQTTMRDPLTHYPRSAFDKQPRPAPGLAGQMRPRPDHGETSCRGMGRLSGRRALTAGADGGIGRAVATAFAREGAHLALNYLHSEQADAREVLALVADAGRQALALPGDITGESFCRQLVAGKQVCIEQFAGLATARLGATFRTKRPGQPAELAPVHVLLASQQPSVVTGEIRGVTGGHHLP